MARLEKHLADGETVRRRVGRLSRWAWASIPLLVLPTVISRVNLLWQQDHEAGFLREGLELPFAVFARIALLALPILFALFWLNRWRVAVTDRRVLVRQAFIGVAHDEIGLDEITEVRHDWEDGMLILSGAEKSLEIPCDDREAADLLEALHDAYYPKPNLLQRLWMRLRGREG